MRNIILIGFMACGKSTLGRYLAKDLGMDFLDTDRMIENKTRKTTVEVFNEDGEEAFRNWERIIARYLMELQNKVIATGGGMIIANHDLLKQSGTTIYLKASAKTIFERTKHNYQSRPLINYEDDKKRLSVIQKLLSKRDPFYNYYSDIIIENNGKEPYNTILEIKKGLGI